MTSHSPETEAERLLALSEKVGRVAESLAELALERDVRERSPGSDCDILGRFVDRLIWARCERGNYLPARLLGEPMWDMLLHLLRAEIAGERLPVSRAYLASGLCEGTARRWLDAMVEHGLATLREAAGSTEPLVELAPDTSNALRRYVRTVMEER